MLTEFNLHAKQIFSGTRLARSGKYPQMSTNICKCPQISSNLHKYPQMSTNIRKCPQISANVHKYPQMSTNIHKSPQISANVHKYSQISTNVHKYPQMSTNIHKYPQMATNVQKYPQIANLSIIPVVGTLLKEPGDGNMEVMQCVPLVLPDRQRPLYGNMAVRRLVVRS
jgi:hypothetical protein